jgi:hypothetical protein
LKKFKDEFSVTEAYHDSCHSAGPQHPANVIKQLAPVAFEEQVHVMELELQLDTDLLRTEGLQHRLLTSRQATKSGTQTKSRKIFAIVFYPFEDFTMNGDVLALINRFKLFRAVHIRLSTLRMSMVYGKQCKQIRLTKRFAMLQRSILLMTSQNVA